MAGQFETDLRLWAGRNVPSMSRGRVAKVVGALSSAAQAGEAVVNVLPTLGGVLVVMSGSVAEVRPHSIMRTAVDRYLYSDMRGARRAYGIRGHSVHEVSVVLEMDWGDRSITIGVTQPSEDTVTSQRKIDLNIHNADVAVEQIRAELAGRVHDGSRQPNVASRPQPANSPLAAPAALFSFDIAGPEHAIGEANQALGRNDSPVAFERSVKALDRLHDLYVFEQFSQRSPSSADDVIVATLVQSLERLRVEHPAAAVHSGVLEATHRLRTISTAVDGVGGDSTRYRQGLDELARLAPDVDVSGVYWE